MPTIQHDMQEFKKQLEKGSIQKAYAALIAYMMQLRAHFVSKYGNSAVSGLYQGYMDMTYFAIFPSLLKQHDLKVAIVFNYDAFRLEAWLAARNRKVQQQYWERFKDGTWPEYRIVMPAKGIDSILEYDLAEGLDLGNPETLTSKVEALTTRFIDNLEHFLTKP